MISRNSISGAFPIKRLGEVVEFLDSKRRPVTESDRRAGPFPYYGANGIQGAIDEFIFDEPLVLLAEDGGHFGEPDRGIAYRISGKTWVNNHAHVLRPTSAIELAYLCRVLENYDVTPFVTGTTRGKLTKAGASEIVIPLPPLAEQRRIAEVLDRAQELRAKRRAALAQLDSLTQSLFLDLFGDPVANPRGWPMHALGMISEFSQGIQVPVENQTTTQLSGYVQFLRISDYTKSEPPRFVRDPGDAYKVVPTTVVMIRYGEAGRVVSGLSGAIANNLFKIVPDHSRVHEPYLVRLLQHDLMRKSIQAIVSTTSMPQISHGPLRKLEIIVPPIPLQREFARRVTAVEALKTAQRASLAELDALFATLQHRAFRGEL